MKLKYVLGIVAIIIFALYVAFFFRRSLTPYVSFEAARETQKTVQIIGDILHQETSYDLERGGLRFAIEDKDKNRMNVEYSGTKPANFDQSTTAVVVGRYTGNIFIARKVLVKCPSKYQGGVR